MDEKVKIEPLARSPDDAGKRLGLSTRAIYNLIATGELRSCKVGKRRLVLDTECVRFLERKMREAS